MEKKKILWVTVIVCVFFLIVFGTVYFLTAPSKNANSGNQTATAITPAAQLVGNANPSATVTNPVDPDAWVKEPEKAPTIDAPLQNPSGNINLTIVNGDNATAQYTAVDVSGLTKPIVNDTTANEVKVTEAAKTATTGTAAVAPKQEEAKVAAQTTAKPATVAKPAVAPAAKEITVTEYWIQTGSFSSRTNAEKARDSLKTRYLNAEIFTRDSAGKTSYRVRVGPYKSKAEANYWLGTVTEIKEFEGSYVSEVKTKK